MPALYLSKLEYDQLVKLAKEKKDTDKGFYNIAKMYDVTYRASDILVNRINKMVYYEELELSFDLIEHLYNSRFTINEHGVAGLIKKVAELADYDISGDINNHKSIVILGDTLIFSDVVEYDTLPSTNVFDAIQYIIKWSEYDFDIKFDEHGITISDILINNDNLNDLYNIVKDL